MWYVWHPEAVAFSCAHPTCTVKDSDQFVNEIRDQRLMDNEIVVSFDVQSLFTCLPVQDCIEITKKKLLENNMPIEYAVLLEHCLTSGYLLWGDDFYVQMEGVAMGSPVSPVVADILMEDFEKRALSVAPVTQRARGVCDKQHLAAELQHVEQVLKDNNLNVPRRRHSRAKPSTVDRQPAILPYMKGVTDKIGRILKRASINTYFKPPKKINQFLRPVKCNIPFQVAGVYKLECDCGLSYIGQTKRSIGTRVKEHIADMKHRRENKSAVCEHALGGPNHYIRFDRPQILAAERRFVPRMMREAIEIKKYPNFNREDGWFCERLFDNVSEVMRHVNDHKHDSDEGVVYPCPICEYGYANSIWLKGHLKAAHDRIKKEDIKTVKTEIVEENNNDKKLEPKNASPVAKRTRSSLKKNEDSTNDTKGMQYNAIRLRIGPTGRHIVKS
ncbi:hypothetical protein evm_002255 [Chilo suppressalis]|nr:hypothetical protein evm_002255 [Chilo suppressalis]